MQTIQIEKTVDENGRTTMTYEKDCSVFTSVLKRTRPPMPDGVISATMIPNNVGRSALIGHLVVSSYTIAEHLKMPVWQLLAEVEKHVREQHPVTMGVETK